MRQQKIRGQKKRHQQIEEWRLKNLNLRFDLIEKYHYDHIDIIVHPWCDISIINSLIPEPRGKTKQLMLGGLIDIYNSWKLQLDKLGQPYYLKIWLFEPRFSKSQVVCAIGDSIDYYERLFFKSENNKLLITDNYGQLKESLEKLNWEHRIDEDHFDNCQIGEPEMYASRKDYEESKIWFNRLLKKTHRTEKLNEPIGEAVELYSFKRGDLWLGGQKSTKNAR